MHVHKKKSKRMWTQREHEQRHEEKGQDGENLEMESPDGKKFREHSKLWMNQYMSNMVRSVQRRIIQSPQERQNELQHHIRLESWTHMIVSKKALLKPDISCALWLKDESNR